MIKSVALSKGKNLLGKAVYRILDLDSDILGFKTAKIDSIQIERSSKKILILKLIRSFIKEKIEYVTFRIKAKDLTTINILEKEGFVMVDGYLIFIKELEQEEQKTAASVKIREVRLEDSGKLQKDLGPTFIYSRFFNDPLIKKDAAIRMHKTWINNCIEGRIAEKVYVAEVEEECAGFIAVVMEGEKGYIPLIGVSPKWRGKKISQKLILYAINNWFIKRGARLIRVETQLTNIPAARVYENLGFRLVDSEVTLRWSQRA